jgi:hypothetical protein
MGALGEWSLSGNGIGLVTCGPGVEMEGGRKKTGTSLPALIAALLLLFLA